MNKIKIAYYILLFVSALEMGRGVQMILSPLFNGLSNPWLQLYALFQVIISALLYFASTVLKPMLKEKTL